MKLKDTIASKTLTSESGAFLVVIVVIWLNEIADLPHHLLGAPKTPINFREGILESLLVLIIWFLTILVTAKLLHQIKFLHGLLPVCSGCKKIRTDEGAWKEIEVYIEENSDVEFTHGMCPECIKKYYPEYADKLNG